MANLVANVTISGNTLILAASSNVQYINAASSNIFTFAAGVATVNRFPAVSCGTAHTAILMTDGTIKTFGTGAQGRLGLGDTTNRVVPVTVPGIAGATAVACGYVHTVVLLSGGTVMTFGYNLQGQLGVNDTTQRLTPVPVWVISSSAVAVAGGGYHTAVLLADGTVRTFGRNDYGQLGVGDITNRSVPLPINIISSATAVACGMYHTAVLLANGTVWTFGRNDYGQLGDNSVTTRLNAVQVFGISSSATAVAGGRYHTTVLLADGTVRTFGRGNEGQLGNNNTAQTQTPVQVWGISSSATSVACGQYYTAVPLADGTVRTFGANTYGELGVNNTTQSNIPVQVFGISSSAVAVAGGLHTAIILSDGTLRTFGYNTNGQLGLGDTASRLTPVQVVSALSYAGGVGKVAAGGYHTAVVLADGTVRTFGRNGIGQLGVNDNTSRQTPVQVWGISSSATAVAAGFYHTAVLLADGTVRTFGYNGYGVLGVNDTTHRSTPVQVWGISSSATAIACGRYHNAIILSNGTVRTFGRGSEGQLGINDTASRQTPVQVWGISSSAVAVACGSYFTAVVLSNGTVQAFGRNDSGQLGVGDTTSRLTPVQVLNITSATSVAANSDYTLVLLADGTVRAFGFNGSGQLGVGDSTQRNTPVQVLNISTATAVACGSGRASVLLADGTVRTFGNNGFGQLGINDTASRQTPVQVWGISSSATAIAGGSQHMVVLTGGTVRTFGWNNNGQLGIDVSGGQRNTPVQVLNIANAGSLASTTFITNATAIVIPLTSASTPVVSGYLLSTAAIITYPFIQFPALNLGPVQYPQYQLELTTDYARKLTTSTWTIGSDERLKTDIETANVDRCVEIVQNLDLKRFAWNFPDGSQPPDAHSLGWIAQEFAQFFPRSVDEAPAHGIMDFKNLNSDQIIKVMWGALKKLRADLKSQKSSDSELSTAGDNASPTPE